MQGDVNTVAQKIVGRSDIAAISQRLHERSETVVLCHGIFDLLHPGHVHHLQEAAELGSSLVVSVTADEHVTRGPGHPVFSEDLRMSTLAALACVDWVTLADEPDALAVIDAVQPDVYCKGPDSGDPNADPSSNLAREGARVEEHGGEVRLLGGAVYSSTKLLNHHFDVLPVAARGFALDFSQRYDADRIRDVVDRMAGLRALVVGDVIIDEYVYADLQGITGKDHTPSVRFRRTQRQWGGAYAIARHLAGICGKVTLTGIAQPGADLVLPSAPAGTPESIAREFETDDGARTVVKRRYVVENRLRAELDKIFAVNHLPEEDAVDPAARARFQGRLERLVAEHDVILVADYGHGLLDQTTMDLVQDRAPYLALNCQTNSANYGFNLITKYRRADTLAVDEAELRLAFRDRTGAPEPLLVRLRQQLSAEAAWLTRGAAGSTGVDGDENVRATPALTLHVTDTIGAGDAFFALASMAAAMREPVEVGSFLGNVAGALAANIVGNTEAVEKTDVIKFAGTVLNV
jgi:rfaE bifunctional protein nucleotidyltransferase chain/domain